MSSYKDIITNFDRPLMEEAYNPPDIFNFSSLPGVIQNRFFEIASTSKIVNLKQVNSHYLKLAEKTHGQYPVDRLELRVLKIHSPIRFNQYRLNKTCDRVEWIANPSYITFDSEFLSKLNIRKELAFIDVAIKDIEEVMEYITWSSISRLQIRGRISWETLQKLKTKRIKHFKLEGEIMGIPSFEDFLRFISGMQYI